jgi:hypothetical protein
MLKRKKAKSYDGCIFVTQSNSGRKYVIEEKRQLGILDYLFVKEYPLIKNNKPINNCSFKSVDNYFKNGNWIEIGNIYKKK